MGFTWKAEVSLRMAVRRWRRPWLKEGYLGHPLSSSAQCHSSRLRARSGTKWQRVTEDTLTVHGETLRKGRFPVVPTSLGGMWRDVDPQWWSHLAQTALFWLEQKLFNFRKKMPKYYFYKPWSTVEYWIMKNIYYIFTIYLIFYWNY